MTAAPPAPPVLRPAAPGAPLAPERVLSTLNRDGSRRWIKPKPSSGRFLRRRRATALALILLFTSLPYVKIAGKPAVLLDLVTRRFTFFGTTFLPTDTLLLALLLVGAFVGIFLLTALLGRVWCGWACPQTVYMEMVYRPIERFFEGPPGRVSGRFRRSGLARLSKHATFLAVSCFLAHIFLAYFVGVETLSQWMRKSPLSHPGPFLVMAATTALMMFDFGYFREQMCILACPYGRLQSVMLDRQSLIISYDARRGEPRGRKRRESSDGPRTGNADAAASRIPLTVLASDRGACGDHGGPDAARRAASAALVQHGDCVDCRLCVTTCPTGIDIRDGLQMECIGCAQCIDACDEVMTKIGRPKGLIRYGSQASMEGARGRLLRARVVIYPLILIGLGAAFVLLLMGRQPADVTVLRGLGKPFIELSDGMIGNQVRIKIINRTDEAVEYRLAATGVDGVQVACEEAPIRVGPGESRTVPAIVAAPAASFDHGDVSANLRVEDGTGRFKTDVPCHLLGPARSGVRRSERGHAGNGDS